MLAQHCKIGIQRSRHLYLYTLVRDGVEVTTNTNISRDRAMEIYRSNPTGQPANGDVINFDPIYPAWWRWTVTVGPQPDEEPEIDPIELWVQLGGFAWNRARKLAGFATEEACQAFKARFPEWTTFTLAAPPKGVMER
jgi:hypothetical protein